MILTYKLPATTLLPNLFTLFAPFPKLNVTLFTKEDDIHSDEQISTALNIPNVAGLNQVHGNQTIRVTEPLARTEKADGMITDQKNLVLTVRTADCQPFVVFAPEKNVLGVIHAGWRGLIAGVIPNFFEALNNEFGIEPKEALVAAGPSLCKNCALFSEPETELKGIDPKFIYGKNVDLNGIADTELFKLGVQQSNFEHHPDCTNCMKETYWTYRGGDKENVLKGHTNVVACWLSENPKY